MPNFQQAIKKAEALNPARISNDLFKFIRTIERELAEYNRKALNEDSEDVYGNPIGFYSRATEWITTNNLLLGKGGRIKKEGEPFDLEETGKFLGDIFSRVESENIFFDTKDEKKPEVLENLLSKDIFGLRDEDLRAAIDKWILPFFLDYFRREMLFQ